MTESEMNAIRELFTDEVGKANKGLEDRLGERFAALEKSVNGRADELLDRLAVVEQDIRAVRARLEGLSRLDTQRRLEALEARLDKLERRATP